MEFSSKPLLNKLFRVSPLSKSWSRFGKNIEVQKFRNTQPLEDNFSIFFENNTQADTSPDSNVGTSEPTKNEISKWQEYLQYCQDQYGKDNGKTTECMINLGHAYMRQECYKEALATFKNTVRIRRSAYGNDHLSVGRALDCVGRAAANLEEFDWGLIALYEAFQIRYRRLGPWHIDVADTLNNIAGIFYRLGEMKLAEEAYREVLSVRKAVWGDDHPSVAVTSCFIGKAQLRRSDLAGASSSFNEALHIYRVVLNLPDTSPTVKHVLKNITRTERLMVSMDPGF